jgi:isochorismate synthase
MTSPLLASAIDELARHWPSDAVVSLAVAMPPRDPVALLRAHRSGPVLLWASPDAERDGRRWVFAGVGEAARVDASGQGRIDDARNRGAALLARVVDRAESDLPSVRLFGGVSFRAEPSRAAPWSAFSDASFALPRWLYGSSGESAFLRLTVRQEDLADRSALLAELDAALGALRGAPRVALESATASLVPDEDGAARWASLVGDALARIGARKLDKVVAARCSHLVASQRIDVASALERMGRAYPDCTRFAVQRGASVFLGVTPERLVTLRGFRFEADALAGSARRDEDDDEGALSALLDSDKDRREHAFVVSAIRAALGPICEDLRVPAEPVIRTLRNVHHLWTPIAGVLREPAHALDLVRALHPTPAVCGLPKAEALEWIASHEPTPRGWYAGAVGWFDATGDGSFSVAIRSGVIEERQAWLYAGAGIVEGSDPAREYAETAVKQAPLLSALGVLP